MDKLYLNMYYSMKRIRMVENAIAQNYNNEIREMHTPIHLYNGQEAVAVGICSALKQKDVIFSNHRCHGHYLAKGGNLDRMMAELHNKETGCCKGHGGSMHLVDKENGIELTSAIVAGNVSIATGYALSQKIRHSEYMSVVFFGDGASEEGSVYESICFAKINKLPILFVCENNLYAISTPIGIREPNKNICSKFETIIPSKEIDGNDVLCVYDTAKEMIQKIRTGQGPVFLECKTYRFKDHHNVGNGIDNKYRKEDELVKWLDNCPIKKLEEKLKNDKILNDSMIKNIDTDIQKEIANSFTFARKSKCPNADLLYEGMWG